MGTIANTVQLLYSCTQMTLNSVKCRWYQFSRRFYYVIHDNLHCDILFFPGADYVTIDACK